MSNHRVAKGMLTLVCVKTGHEIASGAVYTQSDLTRAKRARLLLRCAACGTSHLFLFANARLKPHGAHGTQA